MKVENIPADIKSKSLKEAREEIDTILSKLESHNINLDDSKKDYQRLIQLNKHIDELFKKKFKEISVKKNKPFTRRVPYNLAAMSFNSQKEIMFQKECLIE